MEKQDVPYEQIAKFLACESSPKEKEELIQWINAEEGNSDVFADLQNSWEQSGKEASYVVVPDKEKIWNNIHSQNSDEKKPGSVYTKRILILAIGMAASISLLIGIPLSLLFTPSLHELLVKEEFTTIMVPFGQKSQITLSDGTLVWINAGSTLIYSNKYNKQRRTIQLDGEAFFEVKSDPGKPFIVETGDLYVNVLGTAFNVRNYEEDAETFVSLMRGKVSITSPVDETFEIFLTPNQEAIIMKRDLSYVINNCDAEVESMWRMQKMKFDGATPEEMCRQIERWYGVKIKLENTNPDTRLWFTVKTESLTELLESLKKLTPVTYDINGEEVYIRFK